MKRALLVTPVAAVVFASCAPVAEPDPPADEGPAYEDIEGREVTVGDEARPVKVFVPSTYDPAEPLPFVYLLHGYGITGGSMDALLRFSEYADAKRFIYARPTGTFDSQGNAFWNATDTCCDFERTGVDDSAFLRATVEAAREVVNVDPARVFVLGHSNGGFMAQRLACDHADVFAAIVSIAGATPTEGCAPSEPVAVLQVHGTDDETIAYEGGELAPGLGYPGAEETAATWAARNACAEEPVAGEPLDLEAGVAGAETTVARYEGCAVGGGAELWTSVGGTHVPNGTPGYLDELLAFLLRHAR